MSVSESHTHQELQGLLKSQAGPCLQARQGNRPVPELQVWRQEPLQSGLWIQDTREHHPSPLRHQNSDLEYLEVLDLLWVQENLQGKGFWRSRGDYY